MPMGPYKDFQACMVDMMGKGKDKMSASKICGEMKKRTEAGEMMTPEKMDKMMKDMEKKMMTENFTVVNPILLTEYSGLTEVEVLRTGTLQDRGLQITGAMLKDFVKNFQENTYGTELQVNLGHDRDGEAAGWIKELEVREDRLFAKVEWTPLGEDKIKNKLFKFVSAEFADKFPHYETGKLIKNVFVGLALTNVPALKGQEPIALSEEVIIKTLMIKKLIANLKERKIVSKDDKNLLKDLFNELTEDEQAEVKDDVEQVNEKPEEETKPEEKPEGEPEGEAKPEELAHKLTEQASQLKKLTEQNNALTAKIELQELTEKFDSELALSSEKSIGFLGESKDKVVAFMQELSESQRATFTEIVTEVRAADLNTYGSTNAVSATEDKILKLSEQLLKEGKAKDIAEAQKMAQAQLTK